LRFTIYSNLAGCGEIKLKINEEKGFAGFPIKTFGKWGIHITQVAAI
jgi:hypothetical protein